MPPPPSSPPSIVPTKAYSEVIPGSYIVTLKPNMAETATLFSGVVKGSKNFDQPDHVKSDIAAKLGITGTVNHVYPTINAVHIKTDANEAELLSNDKRVLKIEPDMTLSTQEWYQQNPGWALDRINSTTPTLDTYYSWNADGTGRTIYVLDSGVNTALSEFGGRASTIWDVNDPNHITATWGQDCLGHGTMVADAAAGQIFGVAKGVSIISAKITNGCTNSTDATTSILAFDWLAANAPAGTIVNWSYGIEATDCNVPIIVPALEAAMIAAYNSGIITVVAAGNDGCNTANYTPTRIDQVFVVGATSSTRIPYAQDAIASFSRTGWQIDLFAPGVSVNVFSYNGLPYLVDGTSISAPFVSGLFAIGCELYPTYCTNPAVAFSGLKSAMTPNTVVNTDGNPLTGSTSLMIYQGW